MNEYNIDQSLQRTNERTLIYSYLLQVSHNVKVVFSHSFF